MYVLYSMCSCLSSTLLDGQSLLLHFEPACYYKMGTPEIITKWALCYYKMCSSVYYKMGLLLLQNGSLLQNGPAFITKWVHITKWVVYYKMGRNSRAATVV